MLDTMCTYPDRDNLVVAYLYDDIEPAERVAFHTHLTACARCSRELAELRGVRTTLSVWTPPGPVRAGMSDATPASNHATSHEPQGASQWWHDIPAWAQVAAALLVLGVSAGIANVEVRHDNAGWTVRTGWSGTPVAKASPQPPLVPGGPTPWRGDLLALEQQLRSEFHAVPAPRAVSATSSLNDAELQRRVRSILDESERRQERELALRVAEVLKDVNAQRQADLAKIDNSIGFIQRSTYGEQMKQREVVNYLLKVSQKQ